MFENFTDRAKRIAEQLALRETNKYNIDGQRVVVNTCHLLLALQVEGSGVAAHVLTDVLDEYTDGAPVKSSVRVERMLRDAYDDIEPVHYPVVGHQRYSNAVLESFRLAEEYRKERKDVRIGTEHLLMGLMRLQDKEDKPSTLGKLFYEIGIGADDISHRIDQFLGEHDPKADPDHDKLPYSNSMMNYYDLYRRIVDFSESSLASQLGDALLATMTSMDTTRDNLLNIGKLVQDVGQEHTQHKLNDAFRAEFDAIQLRNAAMEECLKHYADPDNWNAVGERTFIGTSTEIDGAHVYLETGNALAKLCLEKLKPAGG